MADPGETPQILIVDDDEGLLILMTEALRSDGYAVVTASSGRAALAWLEKHRSDLILLDLKLPDVSGFELVENLRRRAPPVPFVVVTGQGDEKVAVEMMKQGALDYVMKDTGMIDLLPTVVKRALGSVRQEKALAGAQIEQRRLEGEIAQASERERQLIGADLHDGLGQQLTAIELLCAALKKDVADQPALAQRLEHVSRMLREAVMQTRFLAHGLMPVGNSPDSLQIGLDDLVARSNTLGQVRCKLVCRQPIRLEDPIMASHVYRIAQEAINNAIKHAHARQVTVKLAREDGVLVLEVIDDGSGLPESPSPVPGLGLGVMQHRARLIGAELTIGSKRGEGVRVRCRVPLKK
jgi:signal transduction histidine kinase